MIHPQDYEPQAILRAEVNQRLAELKDASSLFEEVQLGAWAIRPHGTWTEEHARRFQCSKAFIHWCIKNRNTGLLEPPFNLFTWLLKLACTPQPEREPHDR